MEMKRGGSPADKLHPVSPHVGMHLDPSIAWGNDEDDYGNYEEIQTNPNNASISSSISPIQQPTTSFPTMQSPSSSTHPPLKSRKRTTKSSSVYAKSNTSRMQRTTSKFDLGAMQLSGMGLSHSASTLNFLQNALDDELSAAQLNRVPSWAKIASNQNSIKSSGRNGKSLSNNNNSNNNNNNNMTSIPPVGFLNTDSKGKHVPWGVTSPPGSPARDAHTVLPKIRLGAILKPLRNGTEAIVDDSFWRCFEDREDVGWNWNFYLFPVWCVGVLVRYLILFPIRVFLLLLGMIVFFIGFFCIRLWYLIGCNCRCCGHSNNLSVEAGLVRLFALSFVVSWSGVIRYHGIRPSDTMKKRVFVANHSSMIDVTMLLQRDNYSLVGQAHKSWIRFIQNVMLESLQCVWFNRGETKDRNAVFQKLQKHARNENGDLPPLLVFPEGTCVNTDHIIQFKKGVFSLDQDIAICPVALKYNSVFVDPYWNSRRYSFQRHLFNLMTSFCLICDVYYLEPQYRQTDETPADFAGRVQQMIARRGNLISRDWDGYMKYWQPSARFKRAQQKAFAKNNFATLFALEKQETEMQRKVK